MAFVPARRASGAAACDPAGPARVAQAAVVAPRPGAPVAARLPRAAALAPVPTDAALAARLGATVVARSVAARRETAGGAVGTDAGAPARSTAAPDIRARAAGAARPEAAGGAATSDCAAPPRSGPAPDVRARVAVAPRPDAAGATGSGAAPRRRSVRAGSGRRGAVAAVARLGAVLVALAAQPAAAHFLQLIPSADVLPEGGEVTLELTFTHPAAGGPAMELARPARFGAVIGGETVELGAALTGRVVDDRQAWAARHVLPAPGAAVFFVEPAPYWEPAEGKFIVHYAKVVVDAWASGEGWDAEVGFPVEIAPLARPTGLWTGNLFRGVVRRDGAPVPFAEVEVEFVNDGSVALPNDAFATQVIRADAAGVFAYAIPRAGWWGFAALTEGPATMIAPDGAAAPVEEGALMWVRAVDMAAE
jgi:cobalt/nickel transport protein